MSKARDLANAGTALGAVDATELGYLDGVTSAVQTQIDSKIGSASAINPTIVDAKGDIIAATAADTVARLAVGTNGQVLTAASGQATGLEWATPTSGSLTLLSTTTLSGASTTISSISGSYKQLLMVAYQVNFGSVSQFKVFPNGAANTDYAAAGYDMATGILGDGNGPSASIFMNLGRTSLAANTSNFYNLLFENYSSVINNKNFSGNFMFEKAASTAVGANISGRINTASAITSLKFEPSAGTFTAGTVLLYGVN